MQRSCGRRSCGGVGWRCWRWGDSQEKVRSAEGEGGLEIGCEVALDGERDEDGDEESESRPSTELGARHDRRL